MVILLYQNRRSQPCLFVLKSSIIQGIIEVKNVRILYYSYRIRSIHGNKLQEVMNLMNREQYYFLGLGITIFSTDVIPFDERLSLVIGAIGLCVILLGITLKED